MPRSSQEPSLNLCDPDSLTGTHHVPGSSERVGRMSTTVPVTLGWVGGRGTEQYSSYRIHSSPCGIRLLLWDFFLSPPHHSSLPIISGGSTPYTQPVTPLPYCHLSLRPSFCSWGGSSRPQWHARADKQCGSPQLSRRALFPATLIASSFPKPCPNILSYFPSSTYVPYIPSLL